MNPALGAVQHNGTGSEALEKESETNLGLDTAGKSVHFSGPNISVGLMTSKVFSRSENRFLGIYPHSSSHGTPHMLSPGALFPEQYLLSGSHQHTACSVNTVSLVGQSGRDKLCYFTHFETIRVTLFSIHTAQVWIPDLAKVVKWLKGEGIFSFSF